jgi:hypothetical protein
MVGRTRLGSISLGRRLVNGSGKKKREGTLTAVVLWTE